MKVNVKVDQFRMVYGFNEIDNVDVLDHIEECQDIIYSLVTNLELEKYLGPAEESKGYQGYDSVIRFGQLGSVSLLIGYSSKNRSMGISIDFKAMGLEKYLSKVQEEFEEEFQFYNAVRTFETFFNNNYLGVGSLKMGRYDCAADYIDSGISMNKIYRKIISKEYLFLKSDLRNNDGYQEINLRIDEEGKCKVRTIAKTEIETIEVGDRREEIFLRIYNKYIEGIANDKLTELTENQKDWIRYEVEIKPSREKGLGLIKNICNIKNNDEYSAWIANQVLNNMRMVTQKGRDTKMMKLLEEITKGLRNADIIVEKRKNKTLDERKERFKDGNSGFQQLLSDIEKEESIIGSVEFVLSLLEYYFNNYQENIGSGLDVYDIIDLIKNNKGVIADDRSS